MTARRWLAGGGGWALPAAGGLLLAFGLVAWREAQGPDASRDVRGWVPRDACAGQPVPVRAFAVEGLGGPSPRWVEAPDLRADWLPQGASGGPADDGVRLVGRGPWRFAHVPAPHAAGERRLALWWAGKEVARVASLRSAVRVLPADRVPSRARAPQVPATQRLRVDELPAGLRTAGLRRIEPRAEGGGCVPFAPCTLWLRLEPAAPPSGGLWRLAALRGAAELLAPSRLPASADAAGLLELRLRPTSPEGSVELTVEAAGEGGPAVAGEVRVTLPARWGVPWAEREGPPWRMVGQPPAMLLSADADASPRAGVWDAFRGGCWLRTSEPPAGDDASASPQTFEPAWRFPVPGLYRVQLRRDPLASEARVLAWLVLPVPGAAEAPRWPAAWRRAMRFAAEDGDATARTWLERGPPSEEVQAERQVRFALARFEARVEPLPPMRSALGEALPVARAGMRAFRRKVAAGLLAVGVLWGALLLWTARRRRSAPWIAGVETSGDATASTGAHRGDRIVRLLLAGLVALLYALVAWLLTTP